MKYLKLMILLSSSLLLAACNSTNSNNELTLSQLQGEWQLTKIDGQTINSEIKSTFLIAASGQATGNLACNNFFGTLELKGQQARIDKMGSTRKMCAPAINEVEMQVTQTLSQWFTIKLTSETLTVTSPEHTFVYTPLN